MVDKKEDQKVVNQVVNDPFADFLFGSRSRKVDNDKPDSHYDWVLGRSRSNEDPKPISKKEESTSFEKVVNNVNLPELFTHLDTLMTSAQKLKPLYGNIKPIVNQFLKK